MSYTFSGFFATPEFKKVPYNLPGEFKSIQSPFKGSGWYIGEKRLKTDSSVIKAFLDSSKVNPQLNFIYIFYETFGGPCDAASGFPFCNGIIKQGYPVEGDEEEGDIILTDLVSHLGVRLQGSFFEPFTRGYWNGN